MPEADFKPFDLIFGKVRGYPHWPGRIEPFEPEPNGKPPKKYTIIFYGTGETSNLKAEDLFPYHENKERFGKSQKRKFYNPDWDPNIDLREIEEEPEPWNLVGGRRSDATQLEEESPPKTPGVAPSDSISSDFLRLCPA